MNKPIAYVTGARQFDPVSVDTVLKVGTPLYTHLAELTDDEIIQTYAEIEGKGILKFARAILRKANEK